MTKKRSLWPVWLPYPSSWLQALLILLLASLGTYCMRATGLFGLRLSEMIERPEPFLFFGILALLSPIVWITLCHHLVHLAIARYLPSLRSGEMDDPVKTWPDLMSWWDGLYGWMVAALSTMVSLGVFVLFLPSMEVDFVGDRPYLESPDAIASVAGSVWLICAAYLYQLETLVQQRIRAASQAQTMPKSPKASVNTPDVELNRLRTQMGLTTIKKYKR